MTDLDTRLASEEAEAWGIALLSMAHDSRCDFQSESDAPCSCPAVDWLTRYRAIVAVRRAREEIEAAQSAGAQDSGGSHAVNYLYLRKRDLDREAEALLEKGEQG